MSDRVINPLTGRMILKTGSIFKKLLKKYDFLNNEFVLKKTKENKTSFDEKTKQLVKEYSSKEAKRKYDLETKNILNDEVKAINFKEQLENEIKEINRLHNELEKLKAQFIMSLQIDLQSKILTNATNKKTRDLAYEYTGLGIRKHYLI